MVNSESRKHSSFVRRLFGKARYFLKAWPRTRVHNVRFNALAALTRTFLETAANPSFQLSLFHSNLYRFHVLNDTSIPNSVLPPFNSLDFFQNMCQVHLESPWNISRMTEKQWYQVYLENSCTMEDDESGQEIFKPTRIELASPTTVWEVTWRFAKLSGLGSEHTTFLFKLLHKLLPTKERLHRTNTILSPLCRAQG